MRFNVELRFFVINVFDNKTNDRAHAVQTYKNLSGFDVDLRMR